MPSLQNCKMPERLMHWTRDHETTLGLQFPVHRACRDGDINALNQLLNNTISGNQELLNTRDPFLGWTPALWAAFFGQLACVQRLPSEALEPRSSAGETVLHLAAQGARPNLLHWLLQIGTPYHLADNKGETALHKAARSKSYECTRILAVCGADYSVRNKEGLTPAQVAEQEGGMVQNGNSHDALDCKSSSQCYISSNGYYGYQSLSYTPEINTDTNGHHVAHNGDAQLTNGFSHHEDAMDAEDSAMVSQEQNVNGHHASMPTNGFSDTNGHARKRCLQDCPQPYANNEAKRMRQEDFVSSPAPREAPQPPAVPSTSVRGSENGLRGTRQVKFHHEEIVIGHSSPVEIISWQSSVECRPRTPLEDVGNLSTNDLLRGTHGCDLYSFLRNDQLEF